MTHDVIYSVVVGSRAYGLDGPDSDTDRRGVFLAPADAFWSLDPPPTHRDGPRPEELHWELARCLQLGLAANPTVLEVLWSPLVETLTPVGQQLLDRRSALLSRRVYETYGRYAKAQMGKLAATRARGEPVKWKQAMHMLRLLRAGAHVLRTGEVLVDVTAWREPLLAVRSGAVPWSSVVAEADDLHADLDRALAETPLPAEPDRATVNGFLIDVRRASPCP
ncbi:nucleotidyltransferase domain-containing protein [Virgisporangium ochraceum]|uniref:Nucleotidyltransferase n=1 Tax=Virgisporangium ochraceum TaxID=65505 RepID=A0A8J4EII8_9ACTN|nr:nucleotidyltransferase domain-containing protein [Virgisporangium ochraceum]GIJ73302.1 nucleotidyltransferase [Virgisporangium ochraceum]